MATQPYMAAPSAPPIQTGWAQFAQDNPGYPTKQTGPDQMYPWLNAVVNQGMTMLPNAAMPYVLSDPLYQQGLDLGLPEIQFRQPETGFEAIPDSQLINLSSNLANNTGLYDPSVVNANLPARQQEIVNSQIDEILNPPVSSVTNATANLGPSPTNDLVFTPGPSGVPSWYNTGEQTQPTTQTQSTPQSTAPDIGSLISLLATVLGGGAQSQPLVLPERPAPLQPNYNFMGDLINSLSTIMGGGLTKPALF